MIRYIAAPLLVLFISLQGCLPEPEPVPQTINTYQYYYNYLTEDYDLRWDIDDAIIGTGHIYGSAAVSQLVMDSVEQEVLIQVKKSDSGELVDSLSCLLFQNGFYMLAQLGNEEEPHLLCELMDTRRPSTGMIKLRFMHAAATMDPVDIYIGGDLPEDKVLSSIEYTTLTEYLEFNGEKLWNAIIVTPANTLPVDSTILSYKANTVFQTGWIYLCTISHSESNIESPYMIQVNEQPVY
jgi:hypothetical protein